MRIGTLSININAPDFNYGAILHSWAFQQWLKKQPFVETCEIIDYTTPSVEYFDRRHPMFSSLKDMRPKKALAYFGCSEPYFKRLEKFDRFIKENMKVTDTRYTQSSLNSAVLPYDAVVCESDIIWSPELANGHFDRSFFMALDSMRSLKRIAYAPSLVYDSLNEEQGNELRALLESVEHISCREKYVADIVSKYTNREVTHVVDPVLLLDPSDYDGITGNRLTEDPYVLIYMPVNNNIKMTEAATKYAASRGLKVVELTTKLKASPDSDVISLTHAGMEDFLSAIRYADTVFTNSFHAICFSLLFRREFYVFSREYNGKLTDLCGLFGLPGRFFKNDDLSVSDPIDYDTVDGIRRREKERSEAWIVNALK